MKNPTGLLSLLLIILVTSTLHAQWTQTSGPSGNVSSLAVSGASLFAGTSGGEVYLSTDNGSSWTKVSSGLSGAWVTYLLAVTNGTGGMNLFAGTWDGVFLSTNSGTNWTKVSTGLTYTNVYALAATGANLFVGTLDGGVYLSTNNGASWRQVNTGLSNTTDRKSVV
jgi:ligand-binding sensor domain-containing protein